MTECVINADQRVANVIGRLQENNYETYIVGGAVRDLLIGCKPKDYDVATAATPQQIREVFGRRSARIIGKRFRLVHLHLGGDIIEISTFRRQPKTNGHMPKQLEKKSEELPEHMLFEDNDFGTSREDAFRRDFTVNALFFDPIANRILDYTGMGMEDIKNGVVRVIGDGDERFEEDPVRMLRALKLVGQYGFRLEAGTEEALKRNLPLIKHVAAARLSLELEKILISCYSDRVLKTFHEYGFLELYLPYFAERWQDAPIQTALAQLECRNRRVMAERYRNSISVAVAAAVLPLVVEKYGENLPGGLWEKAIPVTGVTDLIHTLFFPHAIIRSVGDNVAKLIMMQPGMVNHNRLWRNISPKAFASARELMYIQNELWWHRTDLIELWGKNSSQPPAGVTCKRRRRCRKKKNPGGKEKTPETAEK